MVMVKQSKKQKTESDSGFFLKLVLYVIVGSQWLWIVTPNGSLLPLPLGLIVGMVYARHDHFKIDRKIEYAILLTTALIAFWAQIGIFIHI